MRLGKMGWCAAMAGMLASAMTSPAAAPPRQGSAAAWPYPLPDSRDTRTVDGEAVPYLVERGSEEWWVSRSELDENAFFRKEQAGAGDDWYFVGFRPTRLFHLPVVTRKFTIVVRVAEKPFSAYSPMSLARHFMTSLAVPGALPMRSGLNAVDQDEEFSAIVDRLQRKLMELHNDGVFEVVIDPQGKDGADVDIRYQPPPEPPLMGPWFGLGVGGRGITY
jgi:hypothetical protein